jgi:hypothetical protein
MIAPLIQSHHFQFHTPIYRREYMGRTPPCQRVFYTLMTRINAQPFLASYTPTTNRIVIGRQMPNPRRPPFVLKDLFVKMRLQFSNPSNMPPSAGRRRRFSSACQKAVTV